MIWMLDKAFLERLDLGAYDAQTIAKRVGVPLDVAKEFFDPKRQYRVQSNLEYGWVAGKNRDDQPTLVFVGRPRLSGENEDPLNAISFDLKTGKVSTTSVKVDDEDGLDDAEYVLGMLEDEIGFDHVGHANVLAFKHPKMWHYAVVPLPSHLHDTVVGADDADDDEIELARDWIRGGDYVLHCGNAYFMSSKGEVESS
ncbi:MAG: hypothetical protein H0V17_04690 [Deltaproteobacteria bacterium]|nr:hypothetical protein [Deltaproteobacteria bacterium]